MLCLEHIPQSLITTPLYSTLLETLSGSSGSMTDNNAVYSNNSGAGSQTINKGLLTSIKRFTIAKRDRSRAGDKDGKELYSIEKQLNDIAEVLINIVFMGREKRNRCEYYDLIQGLCKYLRIDIPMPTLNIIYEDGIYRVVVASHPEICAICPFWRDKGVL